MTSEWIWRELPGSVSVICRRCAVAYTGETQAVQRLQLLHHPDVCAVRALTPEAKRFRGAR